MTPRILTRRQPHIVSGCLSDAAVRGHAEIRLRRFLTIEREWWDQMNEAGKQLVRHAQFSAFLEMTDLGERRRARELVLSAAIDRVMKERA